MVTTKRWDYRTKKGNYAHAWGGKGRGKAFIGSTTRNMGKGKWAKVVKSKVVYYRRRK